MNTALAPETLSGRVATALVAETGDIRWAEVRATLIGGGKSNLTFLLTSPAGELVLRRPPTGDLPPSAHDMAREAQVQRALGSSAVPVPEILLSDAGALIGAPCYVMERVPGHVIRGELPVGYGGTTEDRRAIAFSFVDTLAKLHAVDPQTVGLGDFGRPGGFTQRQVRRWMQRWDASRTRDLPVVRHLGERLLEAAVPTQRQGAIVHGDYRLDNCVMDATRPGKVNAVLDWEMSTLGDPMTDVGFMLMFWRQPGEPAASSLTPGVTHLPGFPTREELAERYARQSGADLGQVDFYLALAHFKFAVIVQGVALRSRAGAMGGQTFGELEDEVRALAEAGLDLV